jgi:hypothetical protein
MRFCPFCSAENTVEATHCAACARRLPPVPSRRARSATASGAIPPVTAPPTASPPPPSPAPSPNDSGRRSLLAALSPSPAAERRAPAPPAPRTGPEARRRSDASEDPAAIAAEFGEKTVVSGPPPEARPATPPPSPLIPAPGIRPSTIDDEWGRLTDSLGAVPSPLHPPHATLESPSPFPVHPDPPPVPRVPSVPAAPPARLASHQPPTPASPARRKAPSSVPPPLPPAPAPAPVEPPRAKRPSMSPPLYPLMKEQQERDRAAAAAAATNISGSITQPIPPSTTAPVPAPVPAPPILPASPPVSVISPRRSSDGFEPPPTRILRGEELGDRPFAPPHVIPVPELPEPGPFAAARYAITFLRGRWQRRGAIKSLAEDIKRDTDALDQILGSLGRTARSVQLEGRPFAAENEAISAAEARRTAVERDSVELQTRRSDETTKYVDVESDRTSKVSQAEHALGEAQRDLQLLEGQRRNLRDERKRIEARQKGFIRAAEQRDEQAADAPMAQQRGFRADAESHRKSAAELEPQRQDVDRRLALLEKPIADATARVDAAKAELESARRSLDDAREGHGHRLAELEAETKRKTKEIAQADAEIVRRLVTLGTLVNLNRVDRPEFADLYQRIDRLRTAIGARTTEIDKLTAERDAYDKPSLVRGIATLGGTVVLVLAFVVLLRACV